MSVETVLREARAIILTCFHDELQLVLKSHGFPASGINGDALTLYARSRLDARRFSPPGERR